MKPLNRCFQNGQFFENRLNRYQGGPYIQGKNKMFKIYCSTRLPLFCKPVCICLPKFKQIGLLLEVATFSYLLCHLFAIAERRDIFSNQYIKIVHCTKSLYIYYSPPGSIRIPVVLLIYFIFIIHQGAGQFYHLLYIIYKKSRNVGVRKSFYTNALLD